MAQVSGRRPGWGTVLAVAFLVVPLVEVYVVLQAGRVLGAWPTVALLVAMSVLGAYLLRREGPAAWRRVRAALAEGRLPSAELMDAALLLVGGTLLLTPGFFTDVLGFVFVLPPTRPVARRVVLAALRRRVTVARFPPPGWGPPAPRHRPGEVIQGEVVEPEDPDARGPAAPGG